MELHFSPCHQQIIDCKFSPNNQYIAILKSRSLCIYKLNDLSLTTPINTYPISEKPSNIKFSPNSQLILVHCKPCLLEIYKIDDNEWKCRIQDQQLNIMSALFSPSSIEVLSFSDFQIKLSIYSLADKSVAVIKQPKFYEKGYSFSNKGEFMAIIEKRDIKDVLAVYSCSKWKLMNVIQLETNDACDVIWSYDNTVIMLWDHLLEYKFFVYCPIQGLIAKLKPYDYALGIKTVKMSPDSLFVSIGSYDEKVRLINSLTWKIVVEWSHNSSIQEFENCEIVKEIEEIIQENFLEKSSYTCSTFFQITKLTLRYNA